MPPGKILNPKTNRCIDANGKLGKELSKDKNQKVLKEKSVKKEINVKDCPSGKIINPKTNKCIDANGKLGKELAKIKTPVQKDIYDIIHETGNVINKKIDPFDKLKLNMIFWIMYLVLS